MIEHEYNAFPLEFNDVFSGKKKAVHMIFYDEQKLWSVDEYIVFIERNNRKISESTGRQLLCKITFDDIVGVHEDSRQVIYSFEVICERK